jgi:hypothetical protein
MRVSLAALAVTAALLLAACGGAGGSSGSPSPSLPVKPEQLAQPFSAKLTFRFLRGGQPVTLDVLTYAFTVDGEPCGSDASGKSGTAEIIVDWPPAGFNSPCLRIGGRLEGAFRVSEDGGATTKDLFARFAWDGKDAVVDVDVDSAQ